MKHFYHHHFAKALILLGFGISVSLTVLGQNNEVVSVERNSQDHTIKIIRFNEAAQLQAVQSNELFSKYFGLDGTTNRMVHKHTTHSKSGITTVRYVQLYKGIKVEHGSASMVVRDNKVLFATGNYYPFTENPDPIPLISEREAFKVAVKFVGASLYKWQIPEEEAFIQQISNNPDTSFLPKGQLAWIEDMTDEQEDRLPKLAYSFDIYAEKPLSRQQVYVDAKSGKILFSNATIKHTAATGTSRYSGTVPFKTSKVSGTYILFDSTRGNGVYTLNLNYGTSYGAALNFSSISNTWPTATAHNTALDVHWGSEMVYDYWLNEQGRRSWDDMDGVLQSYVHYSSGFNNAFWNGAYMTYGDGSGTSSGGFDPLTSLDVTAHEIGHGVCEATSGLVYQKEAGAMNEGLSDCWAATIEHYADPHEADAQPKRIWYIGEEIGAGTPLRRMDQPKLRNDPDTYGGTYWYNVVGCTPSSSNDYCGVHNNSGVMNKFYYLLTDGGSGTNDLGNAYSVTGLGWTKAPTILYQTELVLTSTATFADCRTASIAVAETLYGPCSPEVKSVMNAWYAVGVGPAFVPCTTTIGFEVANMDINEASSSSGCIPSTLYKIGIKPIGTLFSGGSPIVTIGIAGGTAIAGKDYTLTGTSMTFSPGSGVTQYADLRVFDDGTVSDSRTLKLTFSMNPMGSNAFINSDFDTLSLNLFNNDSIPSVVSPVLIESTLGASCTWNVPTGEEVYFNNPTNGNLIAGLKNTNKDLGCVAASITGAGSGMVPAIFSPIQRSRKELKLLPTTNITTTTYDVSFYLSMTELAGTNPASLLLLKTDAATDAKIDNTNTTIVTPIRINGTNYVGFRGTFTGFNPSSRFMLVDGPLCTPTAVSIYPQSATTFCSDKTVVLKASTGTGYTYQWMRNDIVIPGETDSLYTANSSGVYKVRISAAGCPTESSPVTVTVYTPIHKFIVSGGGQLCEGNSGAPIYLSGSEPGVSYQLLKDGFAVGSPFDGSGTAMELGKFSVSGNYTVVATHKSNGCQTDMNDNVDIEVLPRPIASVTPNGNINIDEHTSVTLKAQTSSTYVYQWVKDGTILSGKTDSMLRVSEDGRYKVIVSNGICADTSGEVSVLVKPQDVLQLTLLPNPNDGLFTIKGNLDQVYEGKASIIILNMLGQKIYSFETDVQKGFVNTTCSLNGLLAKARYLVRLTAADEEHVFHLVVGK